MKGSVVQENIYCYRKQESDAVSTFGVILEEVRQTVLLFPMQLLQFELLIAKIYGIGVLISNDW